MPGPEAEEAAEEVAEEAAEEVPGLITASGVNFDALPEVDVDLPFQGDHVEAPEVRLRPARAGSQAARPGRGRRCDG